MSNEIASRILITGGTAFWQGFHCSTVAAFSVYSQSRGLQPRRTQVMGTSAIVPSVKVSPASFFLGDACDRDRLRRSRRY